MRDLDLESVLDRWRAALGDHVSADVFAAFVASSRGELEELVGQASEELRRRRTDAAFARWLEGQELGDRLFDDVQLRWLGWMRDRIAEHGSLSTADLERTPFAEHGGLTKARQLFGRRTLDEIVHELDGALGPPKKGCGCGGICGKPVCGIQPSREPAAILQAAGVPEAALRLQGRMGVLTTSDAALQARAEVALRQAGVRTRRTHGRLFFPLTRAAGERHA